MKKISILVLLTALLCLHTKQMEALTIKGVDVGKLGQVPGRIKAIVTDIKNIVDSTRTTINTIESEIEKIKTIEKQLKNETDLTKKMTMGRSLVTPSKNMLEKTLGTIKLFINFTDDHLDELVKIFDKNAGQKVEDFAQDKLKPIVAQVNEVLIGVLAALEPSREAIDALENALQEREDAQQEKDEALAIKEQAQKELAEAKAMTREAIRIRDERAKTRAAQETVEDILEDSDLFDEKPARSAEDIFEGSELQKRLGE